VIIGPDYPDNLQKMNKYGLVNVSDPEREITKNYDALTVNPLPGDAMYNLKDLPIPITFLIKGNGDGKIVWKYVGTKEIRPENKDIFNAISRYLY
jgi:peroxiredoxin